MDKKIRFMFILGIIIFISAVFVINILVKRYKKEPLSSVSEKLKKSGLEEEIPVKGQEEIKFPEEELKIESPISETEPLLF